MNCEDEPMSDETREALADFLEGAKGVDVVVMVRFTGPNQVAANLIAAGPVAFEGKGLGVDPARRLALLRGVRPSGTQLIAVPLDWVLSVAQVGSLHSARGVVAS